MEKASAVTIGFFDGVHRGHRFLLQQLERIATESQLSPVCVTFDCHPRQVLQTGFTPSLLTVEEEKLELLARAFSGRVIVLPFTMELSKLSAKVFMETVLKEQLGARLLLMGYNHRFGHGGGTMEEYVAWGNEVGLEICLAEALPGEKVSSSRIRNLITTGEIEHANELLGYPYFATGRVVGGKRIGRSMGFPTANLSLPEQKMLPANGAYAVRVELPDGTRRGGMLSIGCRPTVETEGDRGRRRETEDVCKL